MDKKEYAVNLFLNKYSRLHCFFMIIFILKKVDNSVLFEFKILV